MSKQDEVVKDNELTRELMEKYIDSVLCEGSIVQKIIWKNGFISGIILCNKNYINCHIKRCIGLST